MHTKLKKKNRKYDSRLYDFKLYVTIIKLYVEPRPIMLNRNRVNREGKKRNKLPAPAEPEAKN